MSKNTNLTLRKRACEELNRLSTISTPSRTILRPTSPDLNPSHLIRRSSLKVTKPISPSKLTRKNSTLTPIPKYLASSRMMSRAASAPLLLHKEPPRVNNKLNYSKIASDPRLGPSKSITIQADFHFLERTYPEFKFTLWSPQRATTTNNAYPTFNNNSLQHSKRRRSPDKKIKLKNSLRNTRLAHALKQQYESNTPKKPSSSTTYSPTSSPINNQNQTHSHPSPEKLQTRLHQDRILLHLLDDNDSLVIEAIKSASITLLNTVATPTALHDKLLVYRKSTKKLHNTGPLLKSKKRNLKRGIRKFKRQNSRFQKKLIKMKRQHKQLSEDFNRVQVSKPGEKVPATNSSQVGDIDAMHSHEKSYDDILAAGFDSKMPAERDEHQTPSLSSRGQLRSRSGSATSSIGSRPGSTQSIRKATTRLTRAKEQLRTVIYHDDALINGSGQRLLGRPMSKSQKIRMTNTNNVGLGGSMQAREEEGITSQGVKYQRTIVNAHGACIMMESRVPPPIHSSWLGLEPATN